LSSSSSFRDEKKFIDQGRMNNKALGLVSGRQRQREREREVGKKIFGMDEEESFSRNGQRR